MGQMVDAGQQCAEMLAVVRYAADRNAAESDAVIGALAGDDLVFLRLANGVEVVAQQLHLGVVGIGARVAQEHLGIVHRHHPGQRVRQGHGGRVGLAAKQMRVGEGAHLLRRGRDDFLVAIAQRGAPETAHALQVLPPLVVVDIHALTALDHQLLGGFQVGGRIDHVGHGGFLARQVAIGLLRVAQTLVVCRQALACNFPRLAYVSTSD